MKQQLLKYNEDVRKVITHPGNILPFYKMVELLKLKLVILIMDGVWLPHLRKGTVDTKKNLLHMMHTLLKYL